jgi:hypothetical protein
MADHDTTFSRVKELVTHAVTFAHPKQDYELCLFRDASNFHWGIILTQAPKKQLKVSVHDQEHVPLAFKVDHSMQLHVAGVSLRRKHSQSWNR